jgi:hypothetical protein
MTVDQVFNKNVNEYSIFDRLKKSTNNQFLPKFYIKHGHNSKKYSEFNAPWLTTAIKAKLFFRNTQAKNNLN